NVPGHPGGAARAGCRRACAPGTPPSRGHSRVSTETSAPDETLRCARHPNTETVLRCGRCETPICPRCQIQTPVGARCPTCARVKRFALLVKPRELAQAIAYGVGAAAAGTLALTFIPLLGLVGPL